MISISISLHAQTITNYGSLSSTTGLFGSYFGYSAGNTGYYNAFFGYESGQSTIGYYNTAVGSHSLRANTEGHFNTSLGAFALHANTTGGNNTAIGMGALINNSVGKENTAVGPALSANTTGSQNTAIGFRTLNLNTSAWGNTALGIHALSNSNASLNTATGAFAMINNNTGGLNCGYGPYTLYRNTTGSFNSAFGYAAGPNNPSFTNTTALGYAATPSYNNQVRIGNSAVTSIGGQVSWSTFSDGRFKKDIKEDVCGLDFINKLRPVSYTVDTDGIDKFLGIPDSVREHFADSKKAPVRQSGFIAQEVHDVLKKTRYVFHGVEVPQSETDHYSIRYAEFVIPLVKAVQELTAKADAQQKEIGELKEKLSHSDPTIAADPMRSTGAVLFQNNPNPFSAETEISMSLPETVRQATLILYNMEGKQLKVLPVYERGKTAVKIQGHELKAGMYLYTLIADSQVLDTKRMILTDN